MVFYDSLAITSNQPFFKTDILLAEAVDPSNVRR
jgi:hypothetical protein